MRAAYALATIAFVGVHPLLTHVPPNLSFSTTATFNPAPDRRAAREGPAWPVPTTIASKTVALFKVDPFHDDAAGAVANSFHDGIGRVIPSSNRPATAPSGAIAPFRRMSKTHSRRFK